MQEASSTLYGNNSLLCFDRYYGFTSEHLCVGRPKFTCGAAGHNTTLSYNRRLSDLNSSALFNTTISIAWDPLKYFHNKDNSTLGSESYYFFIEDNFTLVFETYSLSPQDDWLNVSHVYDKPGVYTPIWWLSPSSEILALAYNCMPDPFHDGLCDGTLDRIVVNSNNCSIEPPKSGGRGKLTSLALLAAIIVGQMSLLLV
jgi:hypothetical protein